MSDKIPVAFDHDPEITDKLVAEHGIKPDEYERILNVLGRKPTYTELGIYSVLWSEHCSYKSSRIHLKKFPTKGPRVLQGPGENAGILDIGGGYATCFKMESHNHPSYIEPYQGAATGVGGILRDVFTMGARPIANMDSLRFGELSHPKTRYLLHGVVGGIAGYGNCVGVPTIAGDAYFDESYNGNILVNAFTLGTVRKDKIWRGYASGAGNPIIYVGSKTGRDGIHGATMASDEFSEETESKRPTVQVGDPFTEKLLIEACLELMQTDLLVGIQDMGAAGLTSSTFEMAGRAGTGLRMYLDKVPMRETGMTPYELMLSESQERMVVVSKKGNEDKIIEIFKKWDLDAVVIGEVLDNGMGEIWMNGKLVANIPVASLTDDAPKYDRPAEKPPYRDEIKYFDFDSLVEPADYNMALFNIVAHPNQASKRFIYRQYDHMVQINTVVYPGGDAGVVRVKENGAALAMSSGCNSRYCYLDPYEGAKQAVVETARNVACTGGTPIGITDCLNFGNPEKPEVMWEFVESIKGICEACEALETPVVSGNVSFYNDTEGKSIYPTPTIGMVGIMESPEHAISAHFKNEGDVIAVIGRTTGELGGSEYLKIMHGKVAGMPPVVDLEHEKALIRALTEAAKRKLLKSAHDVAEGGIAVALCECSLTEPDPRMGFDVKLTLPPGIRPSALLFGEDQGRVIVSFDKANQKEVKKLFAKEGLPFEVIGTVGGNKFIIAPYIDASVDELFKIWRNVLPDFANGGEEEENVEL